MSLHKLTAGTGYTYLTRQVAALDSTEVGHASLASYYTEKGEAPGTWMGSGMAGIDGLAAGDVVTEEQMWALFGLGYHPLSPSEVTAADGTPNTPIRLGTPFPIAADRTVTAFRVEVARRVAAASQAAGGTTRGPVPAHVRARVRTEVAVEFFRAEQGRDPLDARELGGAIARYSRPESATVAGYDLTFSPVKTVSALWAVADPATAAQIERAHNAAVAEALAFIEKEALFTRLGAGGVRQVEVTGLVAAAFTHRDSRAGDPDLHTHVAVANKVQTRDGQWRAIDGRVLYKANVSASEVYNTALETHLSADLGVRFTAREQARDTGTRPVREIDGIDPDLAARWSARRAVIETRRAELAATFQADHGRPPTPAEAIHLAQRATLETRDAKHEPRSLPEQRATWTAQAIEVLGSRDALDAMIHQALHPTGRDRVTVDAAWVDAAAQRVLEAMESRRATWQVWHVKAEALRQVRGADLTPGQVSHVVDLIVGEVLDHRSVPVTRTEPGITEPAALTRSDGTSMYEVAGSRLFSSARVLAAEDALVAAAGQVGGALIPDDLVDAAITQASGAAGVTLNPGQAHLVRQMATSGARLQLAIAPAGSGKTTAMSALTTAWTSAGGTVIGLAPSAAAASALRDQTGTTTDTLAKLAWALTHHTALPDWADQIDQRALVIIDEAGMADTLSLATVTDFVLHRGGSIRLIGDTQQLAAIGAGGVLRDIDATAGALHLTELVRFTDPAEAAASLALRDGQPEAIGYYLDKGRVHVGDPTTTVEGLFAAWSGDTAAGRDVVMLAATRDQVTALNTRAQAHLLASTGGPGVALADGTTAHVGDLVITRRNDRTLRTSSTDFVKNGDRWRVRGIDPAGRMTITHTRTRSTLTLPAGYARAWVDLGYASTINTAQGITADISHTLLTGTETRQQTYTALTRGRAGNHAHLQVVEAGDEHAITRPELTSPPTPAEILGDILARDTAPRSVTTQMREQLEVRGRLADATARYIDALFAAAEQLTPPGEVTLLDDTADQILPGLTDAPAWPALRAQLLTVRCAGGPAPTDVLADAAAWRRGLIDARDPAAVLHWRVEASYAHLEATTDFVEPGPGPLRWLTGVPALIAKDPTWGPYLQNRSALITGLARDLPPPETTPPWLRHRAVTPPEQLVRDIDLWRAATGIPDSDHRPTGPPRGLGPAARHQQRLDKRLESLATPALHEWRPLLLRHAPTIDRDPFLLDLTERLAGASRAGINTPALIAAATKGHDPLPDDHAAAALWWRLSAHLSPVVAAADTGAAPIRVTWQDDLTRHLGADHTERLTHDPAWAALAATITHATHRGWTIPALIGTPDPAATGDDLLWHVSLVLTPLPDQPEPDHPDTLPPDDRDPHPHTAGPETGLTAAERHDDDIPPDFHDDEPPAFDDELPPDLAYDLNPPEDHDQSEDLDAAWARAAWARSFRAPLEPTEQQINRALDRAYEADTADVPESRIADLNEHAARFYQACYPGSWSQQHLRDRFGTDLTGHPDIRPGHAPAGWTTLTDHLRRRGATDTELLAAGLATTTRTGRTIDRFRDRAVLPITHNGRILGFVGRRHPDADDDARSGPKYLNTGDTIAYHKGAQLYVAGDPAALDTGAAAPVLVEGPMDAIAVTLAGHGRHLGVAPLGTSLTDDQATQLATWPAPPIVATDNDPAGQTAARRAFWALTPHGLDPHTAVLPPGHDPASLYRDTGPDTLTAALDAHIPLAAALHDHTSDPHAIAHLIAARPPHTWHTDTHAAAQRLGIDPEDLARHVLTAAHQWTTDPRHAAEQQLTRRPAERASAAAPPTRARAGQLLPTPDHGAQNQCSTTHPPAPGRR